MNFCLQPRWHSLIMTCGGCEDGDDGCDERATDIDDNEDYYVFFLEGVRR